MSPPPRVGCDPGVFISALIGGRGGAPDLVMRAFVDDRMRQPAHAFPADACAHYRPPCDWPP